MRAVLPLFALLAAPAHAVDFEAGIDLDAAFAMGEGVSGPGGGGTARLGIGPDPIEIGPAGLSIMFEVAGSYWRFPSATANDTDMIRALGGLRFIYTILWIRPPAGEGGRGRGIRLDFPFAVRGGAGSLDLGSNWTPTADGSVGLAIGFLPVQIGLHVGAGGISSSANVEALQGAAWINAGVDLGVVF